MLGLVLRTSKDCLMFVICNREVPRSAVGIGKHDWDAGHDVYFFPPRGRSQVKWQFLQIAFSVLVFFLTFFCFNTLSRQPGA